VIAGPVPAGAGWLGRPSLGLERISGAIDFITLRASGQARNASNLCLTFFFRTQNLISSHPDMFQPCFQRSILIWKDVVALLGHEPK
jgi:hypothetical protein